MWQKGDLEDVRWGEQRDTTSGISRNEGDGNGDSSRDGHAEVVRTICADLAEE